MDHQRIIEATRSWVERVVIDLNLCPFAKREWLQNKVRVKVSHAQNHEQLLQDLVVELALLGKKPEIETTLLVHPELLNDFLEYNQYLEFVDVLLQQMSFEGIYQVASFHPEYCFAGAQDNDVENYTNRSPYPMLHILREASLERVIQAHGSTESIPLANIARLRELGVGHMKGLLRSVTDGGEA
ncbi:MAG: DUF1415 domain-containing protein [Acidiferrobacterales bacterium]|nr:DUF1415 domain-containing protein [Acidiferrobacterales bacterium]